MSTHAKPYSVERSDREWLLVDALARLTAQFREDALTEEEEAEMIPDSYVAFEYDEVTP